MGKLSRLVAALVVVAALGGCSDEEPEPGIEPSESASTSPPSPSSEPTSPTARELEKQLIEEYVNEISSALSSGDPSGFLALSAPECANCNTLATNLERAYRDGGRIVGGSWTLEDATYVERSELGSIWNADVRSTEELWLAADGTRVKTVRAGLQLLGLAIAKDGPSFQVQGLRIRS